MKRGVLCVAFFGAFLCSGCDPARSERAEAIKELQAHCGLAFTDDEIDRIEVNRKNFKNPSEHIIFLQGVPLPHGDEKGMKCIREFRSSAGYNFNYPINVPVL